MTRKTTRDFHPEALKLFDQYVHGQLSRRGFLQQAGRFTAAGVSAEALLLSLTPNFAEAQQVAPDDKRLSASYVEYPSPDGYGKLRGYLVKPAVAGGVKTANAKGKLPTVLVAHENRGLNPHIEDIARRIALANFIAFAPDALFPLGGYPGDEDKARELFTKLEQPKTRADFIAAARQLKALPDGNGKVGVVGFCYGGGVANYLATQLPDLAAAVPFYGAQPPADTVAAIKAPLLLQYAEQDERINAGWPAYETALKAAKVNYQAFIYPGVQHGFNNDTTPRYDAAAAKLAWERTIGFFETQLRA
ncbi:MAG: dienelactone hydrolase family protein [Gammaproteobacteria bacterium]|nr:dienelactone hydrolase family protein [Gammaproteobacteria bacterium]